MSIKYVDYDGAAGTGDGSSFANRAAKIEDLGYLSSSVDEIRIKAKPVTSVGTCITGAADRHFASAYGSRSCNYSNIVYSTTTGQTYIKEVGLGSAGTGTTSQGAGGWQTGDRIFIIHDASATSENQPSIAGIWEVTVANSYDDTNGKVYLNGYTANSNGTNTYNGSFAWVVHNSDVVKLNTANITKDIACTDPDRSAWTSAGTATTSINYSTSAWQSSGVENIYARGSDKIVVPSSQAVGKIAHYQLPSALDLSGYQQISFMIRSDAGGFTTADEIRLCTDTGGNTSVHTAPIKLRKANEQYWIASVTDLGTNMNSSIQSVALYRAATQSSQCTYRIQNIVACKASSSADSLTHKSLIGLNDGIWYNISWFAKDFVCVKCADNFRGNKWTYYYGGCNAKWTTTGNSVSLYKVEPFYPSFAETTDEDEYLDEFPNWTNSGFSDSNFKLVSGGWSSTDMSSKSGVTVIQGNNWGVMMRNVSSKYIHYKDFYIHGFSQCWNQYYVDNSKWENVGWFGSTDDSDYFYECMSIRVWKPDYIMGGKKTQMRECSQHVLSTKSDWVFNYVHNNTNGQQVDFTREATASLTSTCSKNLIVSEVDTNPGGYTVRCSFSSFDVVDIDTVDASNAYYAANCGPSVSSSTVITVGNMKMKNSGYYYNSSCDDITITSLDSTRPIHPSSPTTLPGRMMGQYWEPSVPDLYNTRGTAKFKVNGGILGGNIELTAGDMLINNIQVNDNYSGVIDQITGGTLQFRSFNQVSNDNRVYSTAHIFSPNTSVRRTPSGYSIKAQVRDTTSTPTSLKIGSIIVKGGTAVTVSIYAYISGSGETVTLKIPGRPFMGLTSDQTASTSAINNWNAIIKTFTPTNSGELEVFVDFSNANTSSVMYIDDFGVTQA
tara:strand:+ start:1026 stop:3698 length:2673 start_codon:yes stop_codon:yes gene_type:complete